MDYALINNRQEIIEGYLQPWKVISLLLGIGILVIGSFYYKAPDWDVPICFIMGILTYLFAPWTIRVIMSKRWKLIPLAAFATWFTIDGSYLLYWSWVNPIAVELLRDAQWPPSLALYVICGVLWVGRGPLLPSSK